MTEEQRKKAIIYVGKMRKWAMEPEENERLDTILSALEPKVMRDWVNKWVPVFTEGLRPQIYIANMLNELGIEIVDE